MEESWKNIKVSLRNEELEAWINVPLSAEGSEPNVTLTPDDVRAALRDKGITDGVLGAEIQKIFSEAKFDTDVLVARGTPPRDGEDARVEYFFKTKLKYEEKEDKDGRIDFRDVSFLILRENMGNMIFRNVKILATDIEESNLFGDIIR